MAKQYANQQPQGFKNYIEKVAIVGVRKSNSQCSGWDILTMLIGRRTNWEMDCRELAQEWQVSNYGHYSRRKHLRYSIRRRGAKGQLRQPIISGVSAQRT